jgi:hypothetical protein
MNDQLTAAQLGQLCAALGMPAGTFSDVLGDVRRLKAMEVGARNGLIVTPGMSPADVATAEQAAAAFAGSHNWTPLR